MGEAMRTRTLYHDVSAIPRPCDIYSIHQAAKFELSEVEDTRQNRINLLNALIEESLRQTALEYVAGISQDQLLKLKEEFTRNKMFEVAQDLLGSKQDSIDYANQLNKFPTLKQLVNQVKELVKKDQQIFVDNAKKYNVNSDIILLSDNLNGEFTASVTEIVLEGLRWLKPAIVDKKEKGYVST
jgi:magnesium chelatase subunit I